MQTATSQFQHGGIPIQADHSARRRDPLGQEERMAAAAYRGIDDNVPGLLRKEMHYFVRQYRKMARRGTGFLSCHKTCYMTGHEWRGGRIAARTSLACASGSFAESLFSAAPLE